MKSKISFFNKAIFKRNMTGGIVLWAGFVMAYVVLFPLILYYSVNDQHWMQELASAERILAVEHAFMEIIWNNSILVPMYAVTAIITAMHLFSYLFTARNSNMIHTYPVSRISLFSTNYISGMLYLTVPQIFASLLALLVQVSAGGGTAVVVKSWFMWIGTMFIETLFFFSLSVCVLMFVGNIAAVPILYLIINFLYRGVLAIFETMVEAACYGVVGISANIIEVLTPILYMSKKIGVHAIDYDNRYIYDMWGEKALFGYFAAAALLTLIAWATYQKKHIETAGDVITVEWMKPIFRWGVAVCTSALGAVFFGQLFLSRSFTTIVILGLIAGIAAFFIAQMLIERSFRVFNSRRVREGILFTAVMCACYITLDADVLGYEKMIPAQDQIGGIKVYGPDLYMYAVSEDEVTWARDIHKQIIDSKKEFESYLTTDGEYYNISLSYDLKDGSSLYRSYMIPDLEEKESVSGQVDAYARQPEVILKENFGVHYPDIEIYGGRIEWYDTDQYAAKEDYTMEMDTEVRLSEEDAVKLYEAVIKDAQEGHFRLEDNGTETVSGFGNLILEVRDEQGFMSARNGAYYDNELSKDGYAEIWLTSAHTNLIKAMDELGYISDDLREHIGL